MDVLLSILLVYLVIGIFQILSWFIGKNSEASGMGDIFLCMALWPALWMILTPDPDELIELVKTDKYFIIKLLTVNLAIAVIVFTVVVHY